MRPVKDFEKKRPEFWAVVKLVSQLVGYSVRKSKSNPTGCVKVYSPDDVQDALIDRGLTPPKRRRLVEEVARYSEVRAELLAAVEGHLMTRSQAKREFATLKGRLDPPSTLLPMNKQKGKKRHHAYLTGIVNMLTWEGVGGTAAGPGFVHSPHEPLTFSKGGMPLRTLFRWMDGAYPSLNHPVAAWEIKEYYGTKTFGSRVADGVYESALDGYELNELRDVGVEVEHYLFVDDHWTWWVKGKSYLCRIVDMLHSGLLDGAFFGREVLDEWPPIVASWPR